MLKIANRILDQIATLLIDIDKIEPQCISQLNLETDLKKCLQLTSLQFKLLKYALKLRFGLQFEYLTFESREIPVKEVITYIILYSDDRMLDEWHNSLKVA